MTGQPYDVLESALTGFLRARDGCAAQALADCRATFDSVVARLKAELELMRQCKEEGFLELKSENGVLRRMAERLMRRLVYCVDDINDLRQTADWSRTNQDDAFDAGNADALTEAKTALAETEAQ